MPFKTQYGSHYHLIEGCHGATIPCGTEGLEPCSDCCGSGSGSSGSGGAGTGGLVAGGGSVAFAYDSDQAISGEGREEPDFAGIVKGLGDMTAGTQPQPMAGEMSVGDVADGLRHKGTLAAPDGDLGPSALDALIVLVDDGRNTKPVVVPMTAPGRFQVPGGLNEAAYSQLYEACLGRYAETIPADERESTDVISYYNLDTNEIAFGRLSSEGAYAATMADSGMSLHLVDASSPTTGYMVASDPGDDADRRKAILGARKDFAFDEEYKVAFTEAVSRFADLNADILTQDNMYLGTWLDPETGICYFDISERIDDVEEAKRRGAERNEIAIWDVANMEEISTGGDGSW